MRCLPKIMAIWGLVVPLMIYPWARGQLPQAGFLGSMPYMYFYVSDMEVSYAFVVGFGLWVAGIGLTVEVLLRGDERERLLRALERLSEK